MSAHFDYSSITLTAGAQCKQKGFTLVELLVVITIIAILSVIGITIFTGVQKGARDARRRGDIDAVVKAMEANYGRFNTNSSPYSKLCQVTDTTYDCKQWFATGIPTDPQSPTKRYRWCDLPQGCNDLQGPDLSEKNPDGRQDWVVCATLEITGQNYCRFPQQ